MQPIPRKTAIEAEPESFPQRTLRRLGWMIRDRWPNRWVERDVLGVTMAMPWSHRLPDYTRLDPSYAMNLLRLAELLGASQQPLKILDIGANIGDSTLLMLDRVDSKVLAVEPDEVFLPYLRHNAGTDPRIVIEESLLTTGTDDNGFTSARRVGGTAAFTREQTGQEQLPVRTTSIAELHRRYPEFADLHLVKSDTDGYDVQLVPAVARTWCAARPVLFFEYDHEASRTAGNEALEVWSALSDLGYTQCAIWDNGGHPLHRTTINDAHELAKQANPRSSYIFWDVAAVHESDLDGIRAIDSLIPGS